MDLEDLRAFTVAVGEGTLSRAARRLRVTQPALSRRIHALEAELQVGLLERHRTGVLPTAPGMDFLDGARRILAQTQAALDRARAAAHGARGSLVLGVGKTSLWQDVVQRAITVLRAHYPTIEIELVEVEAGPPQWRQLVGGELDLAIGMHPPATRRDLEAEPIFDATLDCALLPRSHRLAGREELAAADLAEVPLLWGSPTLHPDLTARLEEALGRCGIRSPVRADYSGPHAIWLAVSAGAGWSPVPAFFRDWSPDGTVAVPVTGLRVPLTNSAIWRRGERRSVVRLVIDALRAYRDGRPVPAAAPAPAPPPPPPARGAAAAGDVAELKAVVAAVRSESLGRAAEELGITQPALSRQIRGLERIVGAPLLERWTRGVRATPAGRSLAADAQRILSALDGLRGELDRAHRAALSRCAIGTVELALAEQTVGQIVTAITRRTPPLAVSTFSLSTPAQVDALMAGRIDLGFTHHGAGAAGHPHLGRLAVTRDTVSVALVPAGHPFASRAGVRIADLSPLEWFFVTEAYEPVLYGRVMRVLHRLGLKPAAVVAFPGFHALWSHLAGAQGWTLGLGRHRQHPPPGLAAVPVRGLRIPWGLDLIWRRDDRRANVRAVVEIARALVKRRT